MRMELLALMAAGMFSANVASAGQGLAHDNPAAVYAMGDYDAQGIGEVAPAAGPASAAEEHTAVMQVNGMVCDFCAQAIKKALEQRPGVASVSIDLAAQTVTMTMERNSPLPSDGDLKRLMDEAGYKLVSVRRS